MMKVSQVTPEDLRGVFAVPPLARKDDARRSLHFEQNNLIVRHIAAGGITLLLDHVSEYELLDDELALTVLRSTGLISRNDNRYREDPAGPSLPIPAAQMHGPWSFSLAGFNLPFR